MTAYATKGFLRPIVQLVTSSVINDKPESVIINKVLCVDQNLYHIADCMGCPHHVVVPNQFAVDCKASEGDEPFGGKEKGVGKGTG